MSERDIKPPYPSSIFLKNKNIELLGEFGKDNFIDMTNFVNNIKNNSYIEEGKDYFDIFIDHSQQILAYKKAIDDIDSKKLKFIEESLNKFCKLIEMPRFLFDIVCSEEFTKMIGHEEVERKATRIIDDISQRTENDITDSEFESSEFESSELYGISEHTENDTKNSKSEVSNDNFESLSHSSPVGSKKDSSPSKNEKRCSIVQDHGSSDDKSKENIVDPVKPDDWMPCTQYIRNLKAQNFSCKSCCVIL